MTSYPAFTFPRKHKRTVKEKVIPLTDEPEREPIYSTLSKKPADLKTTDIDLSVIRVFLVDGSHRTISSTPETTCGEVLDRLLGKLGLIERRTDYALQIKYSFSEPRIANDSEQISKLNTHVWDSVDRIYLCKKDIENCPTPPLPRKKRLASFDRVVEEECSLFDSCAVLDKYMVETENMRVQEPVLVNEQLASRFARAWTVGSEKQQAGESGGQKPMTNTVVFRPVCTNLQEAKPNFSPTMKRKNTYTLERKLKDSTIRRRPPVSPRRIPESFTQETPKQSPRILPKRAKSLEDITRETNTPTTSQFCLQLPTWKSPAVFPQRTLGHSPPTSGESSLKHSSSTLLSQGDNREETSHSPDHRPSANHQNLTHGIQKESDNMPKYLRMTKSEGCLLSALKSDLESDKDLCQTLSEVILRDSGFLDSHSPSGSQQSLNESTASISSLAKHAHKAPLIRASSSNSPATSSLGSTEDVSPEDTTLPATRWLGSSKSMELPTNDDLDTVRNITMSATDMPSETSQKTTFTSSKPSPIPPPVSVPPLIPERSSAYHHNCTIPDEELLKQGKRISRILQLTPKKKVRESKALHTLQTAFSRFGTLFRKGRNSSDSSPSPSPTSGRKRLGFPDSPVSRRRETHLQENGIGSPPKKPAEVNSMGVRMSQVEYDDVSLDCQKGSASPVGTRQLAGTGIVPMTNHSSYDVAIRTRPLKTQQQQRMKPSTSVSDLANKGDNKEEESQKFSSTVPRPKVQVVPRKRRTIVEEYDIATPMKIPPREHHYLTVVVETPPTSQTQQPAPNTYENNILEMKSGSCIQLNGRDTHVYSTPKPQSMSHANVNEVQSSTGSGETVAKCMYENQNIQNGPINGINFGGSPLHVYDAAPLSSDSPHRSGSITMAYENSEIHPTSSGGIAFGGQELHVYEIPPSEKRPPSPPPPPLPPKSVPQDQTSEKQLPTPHPPPVPLKPVPQDQASSTQEQQKSETVGCISLAPLLHVSPEPETGRQTSFSSTCTLPLKETSQNQHNDSHHLDDESHEYYNQNKYSKLSYLKPANPTFTAPPKQTTSDADPVLSPTDSASDIYEPIPDLECSVDTGLPPSLPPLPLEVPGYSKLSFGSESTVNTNSKTPLTRNATICTLIPFGPPVHLPPFIHSQSSPEILSSPALLPKIQSLDFQIPPPPQNNDIKKKPLPPKPEVLNSDSDSGIYDTIPSVPGSVDEHVEMELAGIAPVRSKKSLPPLKPKVNFELPKLPTKLKPSTLHSQLPSQSSPPVKTPPKTLPKKKSQIMLSASSKSADGKTYRSWTSQNSIDNPREELQSKLKRRINIIQSQLANEEANSSRSASTSATVKKPIPIPSLSIVQSTVHSSSPEVSVQDKRVSPKHPATEGVKVPLLPPTNSHTTCASNTCSNANNTFPQKCQTMPFKQVTIQSSSFPPHSDKANSTPKAPPLLLPSPTPKAPPPPPLPLLQAEKLSFKKVSLQSTCNTLKSSHETLAGGTSQGELFSRELMQKIISFRKH